MSGKILVIIFNRPGVAGAVLYTALSFINSLIQRVILFLQIFIISYITTVRAKELKI